ncbi:Centrosomal protein of 131 kDa [Eumeta japonica]|uniref:Centrosomal protein of 131 kDa n=1 Tax=Eumeta variegata TaxID=151549 RepID=A0A4C1T406_EUMVA|nr:Centrosomal protein of 131 kDa [Eumeta japonica]
MFIYSNNSLAKPKLNPSVAPLTLNNIKKAKREDSNLHEFNIDKIDSWMSMHEESSHGTTSTKAASNKHSTLEETFEKFTQETLEAMSALDAVENNEEEDGKVSEKSLDQSQDDSTYDEIVSVIKEIEEDKKKETRRSMPDTNRSEVEFVVEPDIAEDVPK